MTFPNYSRNPMENGRLALSAGRDARPPLEERVEYDSYLSPILPRITTTEAAGKSYQASFPPVCAECMSGPSGSARPLVIAITGCSPECSECAKNCVSAGCH